ncbi:MAG: 50S ribosomal protein L10 [Candidatus Buchananbacteria bacterium]|nr:50S ribosomal protein L10 [Candidatus Buchananbacteria bacterium]
MAKTRQKKEKMVKDLADKVGKAKSLVFVSFDGLKVKEVEELRRTFRAENVDYLVAKKTLMNVAFKEAGVEGFDSKAFTKEVATVIGYDDEVAPARMVEKFSKDHEALKSIGGVLEGKFVSREKVVELSKLPSRDELLAKVVGSINAPVSGFVNVLAGNLRNFVYVLNAIKSSKN